MKHHVRELLPCNFIRSSILIQSNSICPLGIFCIPFFVCIAPKLTSNSYFYGHCSPKLLSFYIHMYFNYIWTYIHINIQRAVFLLEPTPTGAPGLLCLSNLISNMNEKLFSGCQSLNYRHFIALIINKIGISDNFFPMFMTKLCLQITMK